MGNDMTVSSPASWVLQVPFVTEPVFPLKEARAATLAGYQAELRPGSFNYINVVVSDLNSASTARDLFDSLRVALLVASLNSNWGIRVKGEVVILAEDTPMPSQVDIPLIYPEGRSLRRLLGSIGPIQMNVDRVWPRLIAGVEFGLTAETFRTAMNDKRISLALELFIESFFEHSDSARFLGFINVLEVLKDKSPASDTLQDLVKQWKAQARSALDPEEANSVRSSLDWLRSISISRGIVSVVARHLGAERSAEAKGLYTIRSHLIHEGERLPESSVTVQQAEK